MDAPARPLTGRLVIDWLLGSVRVSVDVPAEFAMVATVPVIGVVCAGGE